MWTLGVVAFYFFYLIAIKWYAGLSFKNILQRPLNYGSSRLLYIVLGISGFLLIASAYCFYLSEPWLAIIPIPLTLLAMLHFKYKQGVRMNQIIKKAAEIQIAMASEGVKQSEINKAVFLATTGEPFTIETESDFNRFLKYSVLSWIMGYDESEELQKEIEHGFNSNYVSMSDKIDAIAANYLEHYSRANKTPSVSNSSG